MTAAIALQNIGSDCIRIIVAVAIAAIVFATTAAEVMNSGSGCNGGVGGDSRAIGIGNVWLAMSWMKFRRD